MLFPETAASSWTVQNRSGRPLLAAALAWLLGTFSLAASGQVIQPRLADDGKALILLDEIREPPDKRQPLIALESSPHLGTRQIRVAGKGLTPPATVTLRCGAKTWTIGRFEVARIQDRTHAFFAVEPEVAEGALTWPDCRLILAGAQIRVPRDLLWVVWADPSRGKTAPRLLEGRVVAIVDGDTVRAEIRDQEETIRYIGVNTPELHHPTKGEEPGGREAAEVNRSLVQGQLVRLELDVQERDRYGRLLAYVYVEDTMVNAELVRRGYAQVMTIPPNVRYQNLFRLLQRDAREQKRGLWADPAPPAPIAPAAPRSEAEGAASQPGVAPVDAWTCPGTHAIKGNFTTHSGERCIYHLPGGQFYPKTKPERCYATEEEARRDGCRRSRR